MSLSLDLGKIDFVEFVLENRLSFLHKIQKYAPLLKQGIDANSSAFRMYARDVNNFRLVFLHAQGEMPDEHSTQLLEKLVASMSTVYENRRHLPANHIDLIDAVTSNYETLHDYLKERK